MKTFFVIIVGILSALYLVFPSLGIFELIPDAIPFVGNLDEATATTLLIASLGYFGIDISDLFKRTPTKSKVNDTDNLLNKK